MFNFLETALHSIGEWRRYSRAYHELASLDDRALADIGVSRAEIPFILSHANDDTRVAHAANENTPRAA